MYTIRHTTAFIAQCQGLQLKVKCLSAILGRSISPIVLKNFMHLGSYIHIYNSLKRGAESTSKPF